MNDVGDVVLDELLAKNGLEFVQACYRFILSRDADEVGVQHHLDLLARGMPKLAIVVALADSAEYRERHPLDLAMVVAARRRTLTPLAKFKALFGGNAPRFSGGKSKEGAVSANPIVDEVRLPSSAYRAVRVPANEWETRVSVARSGSSHSFRNLWFDLTTSLQWSKGIIGIIRAELEVACNLKRIHPELRFSMQVENGFAEIDESELQWLLHTDNVAEAYITTFGRNGTTSQPVHVEIPDTEIFFHPYAAGDLIFSMGWKDSKKEINFSILKNLQPDVILAYLVYDIIMLRPETQHFYAKEDRADFEKYLRWISYNCDFLLFGGENTKRDVEAWQKVKRWPVLPGRAIRFGSDIVEAVGRSDDATCLKELGVDGPFLLTVGTAEPRKNYSTLYRAYVLAQEMSPTLLPQLVICGQNGHRVQNLNDQIARDPRVRGRVLRHTPSEDQLAALYRNCLFTLLPSFYEGWSLTLPESFAYGKLCLCADSPPLRETGEDYAEFIDPIDVMAWAKAIIEYSTNYEKRAARERRISKQWQLTTWAGSAEIAYRGLVELCADHASIAPSEARRRQPDIWMDLTLSYLNWNSSLTGVTRVELMYAKTLRSIAPSTRFFAASDGHFFEIDPSYLTWMDDGEDLSEAYNGFNSFWQHHERQGLSFRNPLRKSPDPLNHPAYLKSLPPGSIAFFAGIDFGSYDSEGKPQLSYTHRAESLRSIQGNVLLAHFMHDFTPSDWPHIHKSETVEGYEPFCDYVSNHFDYLVYGGITAQRDGVALQKRRGWKIPKGDPVALGFDIAGNNLPDSEEDQAYLHSLGITSDFVVAVGTLEPRKNHETLYRAYLLMLQRQLLDKPLQMIFVGKPGWNNDDFLTTLASDERIKGKIITIHPSDQGLDILYRHSLFTLLPSFYEGWSLPLPESLAYGKFCLVSDTPPLRERGADFVEFVHPLDAAQWAERIAFYANQPERLVSLEERIKSEWKPVSWIEATEMLVTKLQEAYDDEFTEIIFNHQTCLQGR